MRSGYTSIAEHHFSTDAQIAAVEAEVEKKRAEISRRFEEHRAEYADKVFGLVIGAEDE